MSHSLHFFENHPIVKMITNTDLLPQRYHFLLGMVKDLNVFPFDNDMKKAHFGTKLCIYHEKTVSLYQRNTIFFKIYSKNSISLI
jgi:hypothetical protein